MNIPPIIIIIFVGGWLIFLPMAFFSMKKQKKLMEESAYKGDKSLVAHVYNYIYVDDINGKTMDAYPVEYSKKGKGAFASPVEIIYLEPGNYRVTAHGVTYQKTPTAVEATLEAGKFYCLGANEQEVYLDERSYEWTQS